jgi:hypothetical protein
MATQDVHGTPVKGGVGQTCLVRGTVVSVSGNGESAQITVALITSGHAGDQVSNVTVGRKQLTVVPA